MGAGSGGGPQITAGTDTAYRHLRRGVPRKAGVRRTEQLHELGEVGSVRTPRAIHGANIRHAAIRHKLEMCGEPRPERVHHLVRRHHVPLEVRHQLRVRVQRDEHVLIADPGSMALIEGQPRLLLLDERPNFVNLEPLTAQVPHRLVQDLRAAPADPDR